MVSYALLILLFDGRYWPPLHFQAQPSSSFGMHTPLIGFLLLLVYNVLCVDCVPLPLTLELPEKHHPADAKRLDEANRIANLQIKAMHKVAQDPHREEHHKILVSTFGEHYDIKAIKAHVDTMRHGTVKVSDLRDEALPAKTFGKTRYQGDSASVRFGSKFHLPQTTDEQRAGVLAHEASHALLHTKDYFLKDGKQPVPQKRTKDPSTSISGGLTQGYHELRKDPLSKMHQNADTWKAFGYHALNGKPHPKLGPTASTPTHAPTPSRTWQQAYHGVSHVLGFRKPTNPHTSP
ncbi:hypothetical protein BYT27DRAFT_7259448 [Phlegmacium glaucopus]|nr:hypothetical protein BYT27DRAFT_7259448 [Phlegmacium glaucopus]